MSHTISGKVVTGAVAPSGRRRCPTLATRCEGACGRSPAPEVGENLARGIVARRARDATARVRAGAAHVQTLQRAPVARVTQHWPGREHLIETERAVEDVAPDEPEGALQIERAEDLPAEHRTLEIRRIRTDRVDHQIRHCLAVRVP